MSEPTVDRCRALRHRPARVRAGKFVPCYRCTSAWRRENCNHAEHSVTQTWAGILGWRYFCSACGSHLSANEDR